MTPKTKDYRDKYRIRHHKMKFDELKDKERELNRLRVIINRHFQFYKLNG